MKPPKILNKMVDVVLAYRPEGAHLRQGDLGGLLLAQQDQGIDG
jgi:hypothetical protein